VDGLTTSGDVVKADIMSENVPSTPEGMQWFVLKVQSNRERTIRNALLKRINREGLEEHFGEIIIPTEKVAETKGGKKRIVERKLYPGYIMIQLTLNDESWYLVRDTSGVGDFTGASGKPMPMQPHEIERMLGTEEEKEAAEPARVKIDLSQGETIKINDGPFESFEGIVDGIDEASGKISVLVEIFGQSTPVELESWQVETI
jgi:transcriptional antiterminator NusG